MLTRMVLISWPRDPPTSASQSAGITGLSHHTRPSIPLFWAYVYPCMWDGFLDTAHSWVLTFYPICQSVFFDWFSPFIFKVNIVMCEFDPAILMLAGCFAHYLMQFLHCVDAFYHLVHFWSGWYFLFLLRLVLLSGTLVRQAWWWRNLSAIACSYRILFFLHLWSLVWLDMKFWAESSFL